MNRLFSFFKIFSYIICTCCLLIACGKEVYTMEAPAPSEYMQLQKGKFILYKLDSMRFVNFGQDDTLISYLAKDVVEDEFTDNTGRNGWKIVRYLKDAALSGDEGWSPNITYTVFADGNKIEVNENNLRYLKLSIPVKEGFNWHGNSFLPYNPFDSDYDFSNDEDMHFWDYTYEYVNRPYTVGSQQFEEALFISHVADSVNVPITFPQGLAFKNYSYEVYAKGIGLIEKHTEMWEYQPPAGSSPGYRTGFSIKMEIISHN